MPNYHGTCGHCGEYFDPIKFIDNVLTCETCEAIYHPKEPCDTCGRVGDPACDTIGCPDEPEGE